MASLLALTTAQEARVKDIVQKFETLAQLKRTSLVANTALRQAVEGAHEAVKKRRVCTCKRCRLERLRLEVDGLKIKNMTCTRDDDRDQGNGSTDKGPTCKGGINQEQGKCSTGKGSTLNCIDDPKGKAKCRD